MVLMEKSKGKRPLGR